MRLKTFRPGCAKMAGEALKFTSGSLHQAIDDGCFSLEIPGDLDVAPGIRLAKEFYLDCTQPPSGEAAAYRGFRSRTGIYFDRDHYQTEHILIDGPRRRTEFPGPANAMCERMCTIGRTVLRAILAATAVAPSLWDRCTDQCTSSGGVQWFAVNHYRAARQTPGAPEHKDTGFITVLYYEQPGLEAFIGGDWYDIPPLPGYFLINFGGALEVLTARLPIQVKAVLHRVRQCRPDSAMTGDRFSFAAFLNPAATGEAFQVSPDGSSFASLGSIEAFLRDFNRATWRDDHTDFGVSTLAQE